MRLRRDPRNARTLFMEIDVAYASAPLDALLLKVHTATMEGGGGMDVIAIDLGTGRTVDVKAIARDLGIPVLTPEDPERAGLERILTEL